MGLSTGGEISCNDAKSVSAVMSVSVDSDSLSNSLRSFDLSISVIRVNFDPPGHNHTVEKKNIFISHTHLGIITRF